MWVWERRLRSGAVLSGSNGIPYSWNGRCSDTDREKAGAELDEEKAQQMAEKMKKAQFDFEDYLESMNQMKKNGRIIQCSRYDAGTRRHGGKDAGT